jgi:hypothetical protein
VDVLDGAEECLVDAGGVLPECDETVLFICPEDGGGFSY